MIESKRRLHVVMWGIVIPVVLGVLAVSYRHAPDWSFGSGHKGVWTNEDHLRMSSSNVPLKGDFIQKKGRVVLSLSLDEGAIREPDMALYWQIGNTDRSENRRFLGMFNPLITNHYNLDGIDQVRQGFFEGEARLVLYSIAKKTTVYSVGYQDTLRAGVFRWEEDGVVQ